MYGTLMAGRAHRTRLEGCRYLGTAAVQGRLLAAADGFPALVDGDGSVCGELYELPPGQAGERLLAALDEFEGVSERLFERRRMDVAGRDAWVFVARRALDAAIPGPEPHGPAFWNPSTPQLRRSSARAK